MGTKCETLYEKAHLSTAQVGICARVKLHRMHVRRCPIGALEAQVSEIVGSTGLVEVEQKQQQSPPGVAASQSATE